MEAGRGSLTPKEPQIVAQFFPPVRVEKVLAAKAVTSPKPGTYIYDFGQNLAGVASLRADGPVGTDVRLRFAEVLNPDGTLYTENLRTAKATDHFILAGKGVKRVSAYFYLSWLPVCGGDGPTHKAGPGRGEGGGLPHRRAVYRATAYRQRDDQPAMAEHSVGAAVELRERADGLPAARRAAGLDGGRAGFLAGGFLQHGADAVLEEVCGGHPRHSGRHGEVWHLCAGNEPAQPWLRRRMERCGGDYPVDGVDAVG